MVKGNSRQVIVVNATDQELFDQAIFILKDGAVRGDGVTDEALLREAKQYISAPRKKRSRWMGFGPLWACGGAAVTGIAWLLTAVF